MPASWVLTAMRRRAPGPHQGPVALARATTRVRSRAQRQCGAPVSLPSASTPCGRGVGRLAPRQGLCGARPPPERTRWPCGRGTSAARCARRAPGARRMPVEPAAHGWVQRSTRSPWASAWRRSRDTAPRAVERLRRAPGSRRWAGPGGWACRENPCPLAPRGPVSRGASPSSPQPAPRRRPCWPARSPQAMRCGTAAAMVRASTGSASRRGA